MSAIDIEKQEAQATLTQNTADSANGFETSKEFKLDQYPTTALGGTAVQLRRCTHDRTNREYLGLVLADPYVYIESTELKPTVIFSNTERNEFALASGNKQTDKTGGIFTRPDGSEFRYKKLETFDQADGFDPDSDAIIVRLTGRDGRYIGLCLDRFGLLNTSITRDSTGMPNLNSDKGLFKGVTLGSIGANTQLRPVLREEEIILMVRPSENMPNKYGGDSYWPAVRVRKSGGKRSFKTVEPNIEEPIRRRSDRILSPCD
jgi:hypothetical protein